MVSEKQIVKWLTDKRKGENYKKILTYTLEPRTFDSKVWEDATRLSMQDMGEIIKNMMAAGGMKFTDGKWQTTAVAKQVLKKA